MTIWHEVTKEEFFDSGFNVRKAKLWSSHTNCSEDFAESTFSMNGEQPTHKTIHNNGLFNEPDYFISGDQNNDK